MKNQTRKILSFLLVLVQVLALFPLGMTTAKAESTAAGQTPVLNETIVGTLKFQSFNLLGSNSSDADKYYNGVDYTSTFYYSDDYFSSYANNTALENTTTATHEWHELENQPLATLSAAFALASFTSNEGNCVRAGGNSWNNTDYSNKDSNAKAFFKQCGFAWNDAYLYQQYEYLNAPGMDTIGCVISSKTITVWDAATGTNKPYTLVAVGCRGAGYGAEWANNVTIGDPNSSTHGMINGRHWGFEKSAQTVCERVKNYLTTNHITGDVKYWVTGFSRAAAVSNLVAQKLTDNTGYAYGGSKQNVYGYTWECPQAASVNEDALYYTNIHNILNPMDAVPKVSPDEFEHQRLGIDYRMPYYGNTEADQNTELYNRMYETLKTIAVGTTITGTYKEDELIKAVNPSNYPYNRTLPIYQITAWQLMRDAFNSKLTTNFGTVQVTGSDNKLGNKMLDVFIDNLIDVFLTSSAWTDGSSSSKVPVLTNRKAFIDNYQADFRTLLGYLLDFSGPAFLGMVDDLMSAIQAQIKPSNLFSLTGIFLSYSLFANSPYGKPWFGDPYRVSFANDAKELAVDVVNTMTSGYSRSRDGITQAQMKAALQRLVVLVVDLYAYELYAYNGNYLGTCAHWLNEILCTHEQETVLSWIMSLDKNHINRSTRTIMIPTGCSAKLLEFRDGYEAYDGTPRDADAAAPVVAEWNHGTLTSKDERITYSNAAGSTGYVVIRYPASLNIRVDITSASDLPLANIAVDDYQTTSETVNVSKSDQYVGVPSRSTAGQSGFNYVTTDPNESNATATNTALSRGGTLAAGDTLHVIANPTEKFDDTMRYDLLIDKAPKSVVTEYTMKTILASDVDTLSDDTDANVFGIESRNLLWTGAPTEQSGRSYTPVGGKTFTEYDLTSLSQTKTAKASKTTGIETRNTVNVTPAASVYYDDTLLTSSETVDARTAAPNYENVISTLESTGTPVNSAKLVAFKFTGTRIDLFMNTDANTGGVAAYLLNEDGTERLAGQLVAGKSENELYNVPVVSFKQDDCDTYTLAIVVGAGKSFQLDGVRIYDETKANYASVREALLGTEDWTGEGEVTGTVYLDYKDSSTASLETYTKSGPKGEVYLKKGNGVAFAIKDYVAAASYRIGLSAVNGTPVWVQINDEDAFEVTSSTHLFYDLHPDAGKVVIRVADGSGILSVTDIEEVLPKRTAPRMLSFSVSPEVLSYAMSLGAPAAPAETAEPTPEVTPEPTAEITPEVTPEATPEPTPETTPESTANPGSTISQLLSSFISSLFGSISRMFGH